MKGVWEEAHEKWVQLTKSVNVWLKQRASQNYVNNSKTSKDLKCVEKGTMINSSSIWD